MENLLEFKPAFEGKIDSKRRARTYKSFSKKAGCYIIKENGLIVYIGVSRHCIVKACYRHFYTWNCKAQKRITYVDRFSKNDYTVLLIPLDPNDALKMEQTLIITLNPRDNRNRYEKVMDEILTSKGYIKAEAAKDYTTCEDWEKISEIHIGKNGDNENEF